MATRRMRLGGGLAAAAGGLSWMLLHHREYRGIGIGDHVPPLYNTQILFCVPLVFMGLGLAAFRGRLRGGHVGSAALGMARAGAFVGALGLATMSCLPVIQDALLGPVDCGPLGATLSLMGIGMLDVGLVASGTASIVTRGLDRWNALPLILGLLALGGVPLGYVGFALGGDGLARTLHAASRGLFGLGWVLLGCLCWCEEGARDRTSGAPD